MTYKRHPVDLEKQHATQTRGQPDSTRLDHGHKMLPFDLPVHMTVHRLLEEGKDNRPESGIYSTNLVGWEMGIDCFTIPCQITVQITRTTPYTLEVKIDGEVIRTIQRDINKQIAHQEKKSALPDEEIVDEIIDEEIVDDDDYVFD